MMIQRCRLPTILAIFLLPSLEASWTFNAPSTSMEWNKLPDWKVGCASNASVGNKSYDLVVVGCGYNGSALLDDRIASILETEVVNGTAGSLSTTTVISSKENTTRVVYMSLGNLSDNEDSRKVGASLSALLKKQSVSPLRASIYFPVNSNETGLTEESLEELMTAVWTGLYKDKRYMSSEEQAETKTSMKTKRKSELAYSTLDLVLPEDGSYLSVVEAQEALKKAASMSRGVYLSKDIVNAPHNVLNSLSLAHTARVLGERYRRRLTTSILSASECEQLGMGAFLGVGRGSETEPQFLHVVYRPPKSCKLRIGVVGKGLLFDTGGYNIKTQMMDAMKFDCGGAAAVLGAALALAELEPDHVEVHFCIAACENMINERAMVPSDILIASNGKTIEVGNTDAEGRLTMADALVYADRDLECDEILELSTLTGACMAALGSAMAGLWTKDNELASLLLEASSSTGERIWRMPMYEPYGEQIKSKIADLKNIGGRFGGAITAALFLQNFVSSDTPFAHVDMAGPVWDTKAGQATGWGAKLVTSYVCSRSSAIASAHPVKESTSLLALVKRYLSNAS